MGLETPATDVEVRLEENKEMWGGGDSAGRAGAAAIASQARGSGGGATKNGHIVEATALATLHLEVSEHQGEGAAATSHPNGPAALGIIRVALRVAGAGDLPRQACQLPATGICEEAWVMRMVGECGQMDAPPLSPLPATFAVGGSETTLGHVSVRVEDDSHDMPGGGEGWGGAVAAEGAQEVALVPGGPVVDLEVVIGAGSMVLQLKVAEGEQDGGALSHHDQPRALRLIGVRPREVGAGEIAEGC